MNAASRLILPFLVLLLLVSACRKPADPLASVEAFTGHTCRLTSQTNFEGGTAVYQYDAVGRLTRLDRPVTNRNYYTFEYNSDSTLKARLIQRYADSFVHAREEFRYQQKRLVEVLEFGRATATDSLEVGARRIFTHDAAGRITEEKRFFIRNGTERVSSRFAYVYDARNLIQERYFDSHRPDAKVRVEYTYRYDSYRNPASRSPAFPDYPTFYSLNNVIESSFRDHTGTLDVCFSGPIRYQYRYNEQGYPTHWQRTTCDGKQDVRAEYACP